MTWTPSSQTKASRVVLATSLTSCKDFLACEVAYTFEGATFLELPSDTFVDTILNGINILITSNLGFAQIVCC